MSKLPNTRAPGAGRPPKRPEDRAQNTVYVRLTDAEMEALRDHAETVGMTLGAVGREAIRYWLDLAEGEA